MADKQNPQVSQGMPRTGTQSGEMQNPQSSQRGMNVSRGQSGLSTREPMGGAMMSPFSFMRRFMSEMDNLFEDFGVGSMTPFMGGSMQPQRTGESSRMWIPQIEAFERGGQLVVRADLPGVSLDDVRVNLENDVLTRSGERRSESEETRGNMYRSERSYGSFQRSVRLPEGVDPESVRASFDSGVLEITMSAPKQTSSARNIEVTAGSSAGGNVSPQMGRSPQGAKPASH